MNNVRSNILYKLFFMQNNWLLIYSNYFTASYIATARYHLLHLPHSGLPAIIWCFFSNINIMRMTFSHAGIGYFYKGCFLQFG